MSRAAASLREAAQLLRRSCGRESGAVRMERECADLASTCQRLASRSSTWRSAASVAAENDEENR